MTIKRMQAQALLALQEATKAYMLELVECEPITCGKSRRGLLRLPPGYLGHRGTISTILISAQSLILRRGLRWRTFDAFLSKGSYIYTAKMLHKSGFLVTSWSNVHRVPKELYD